MSRRLLALFASLLATDITVAFVPHRIGALQRPTFPFTEEHRIDALQRPTFPFKKKRVTAALSMSGQFDVSRPVFDLFALRSVRGDALIRYSTLNQSEPLRIILYGFLALIFLAAPSLSEAVGYDQMGVPATAGSTLAAILSVGLMVRECSSRAKQLNRMEKELNAELLPIRLPQSILADTPFSKQVTIKDLRALSNPPRIIALCGKDNTKLQEALKGLSIVGQRLRQASVFVVVVPMDDSKPSDWQLPSSRLPWLADAYDRSIWRDYFASLSESESGDASFRWFGLNSSGRSFGSGEEVPQFLEVLGQHCRPTDLLDETDASMSAEEGVSSLLKAQSTFYEALTTGSLEAMNQICLGILSPQVTEVSTIKIGDGHFISHSQLTCM
jgi:hypothetical protein